MKKILLARSELIVLLILAASLCSAFGPSLHHAPRQDQWFILQDTLYLKGFPAILQDIYSYSRTRTLMPADSILFRPVLFTLLAAEQALFGRHFAWWQGVGIFLHFITVYLLYRLIVVFFQQAWSNRATPPPIILFKAIALSIAIFFGLNVTITETVIWSHINGYILFTNCLLGALLALTPILLGQPLSPSAQYKRLAIVWLCLAVAVFSYELGQVAAILIGVALFLCPTIAGWRKKVAYGLAFVALVLVYQSVNYIDYQQHFPDYPYPPPTSSNSTEITNAALRDSALTTINYQFIKPFFPSEIKVEDIISGNELIRFEPELTFQATHPLFYLSIALFLGWCLALMVSLVTCWRGLSEWILGGVLASLMASVLGLITLRNASITYEHFPTHNIYMGLLLFLLTSGFILSRLAKRQIPPLAQYGLGLGMVGLLLLSAYGGVRIFQVNREMAQALQPLNHQIDQIAAFIEQHRGEADFSIAPDLTLASPFRRFSSGVPMPVVFFWDSIDYETPKYILTLQDGEVVVSTVAEFQATLGRNDVPPFPRLIEFLADFMLFDYQGSYWAVYRQDPYFDPQNASGYECLLNDPNLDSLRHRVDTSWYMRHTDSAQKARRGLSPEQYTAYQQYESPLGIDPEAIIFNPNAFNVSWPGSYIRSSHDMYPLEILLRLGNQVEQGGEQAGLFDLMKIVEQMEYEYTVGLGGSKAQALQDWRRTKAPQDLQRAGIDYLALDSFWLSYTTEAEYNILFDPQQYRLVAANIPYEVVVPGCFNSDLTLTILAVNR